MKRVLSLLLIAVLCLSMTACGFGDPTPEEINFETLKVGVICTTDEEDDATEAAAYTEQILTAVKGVGLEKDQVIVYTDVSTTNSALAEEAIEECIREGCAVIFGTSTGFETAMKAKAAAYPRVTFVGLGSADSTLSNYFAFRIKMYEGAYLSGLIAGIQSKEGKLGMIAPAGATDAETCQIANAFLLGARVEKPAATLTLISTGAAQSESKEDAAVKTLQDAGCDMVLIATKGSAARTAAVDADMKVFTLSTMPDANTTALLYSVMPRLTDMFVDTMQMVLSDEAPYFNDMYVGYADGFLQCQAGSSTSEDENVGDTYVLPGAVQRLMVTGNWDVFSGEALDWELGELTKKPAAVKDAEGNEKIAASTGVPTKDTLDGMTWLAEGITVK